MDFREGDQVETVSGVGIITSIRIQGGEPIYTVRIGCLGLSGEDIFTANEMIKL